MNNILTAVIIGGLLYIGGQYVASNPQREQQAVEAGREITVTGEATVSTRPDIAKVTLGTQTEPQPTAQAALTSLTEQFNQVVAAIEDIGIEEDDIQTTNFSLNPQYDFREGRQVLRGYVASEQVVVTVRNLENVGQIISQATATGANQVGNITFEVDEQSAVQAQAETEAIADAREKAERLAGALGADLGPVKSYSASQNGTPPPMPFRTLEAAGGDQAVPEIPTGTNETEVSVTITFELR